MTHYNIDYSKYDDDPITKHNQAIKDIKEYIGEEKFDNLTQEFKSFSWMSLEQFGFYVSLAGIQGYPVKAWYNYIYGL